MQITIAHTMIGGISRLNKLFLTTILFLVMTSILLFYRSSNRPGSALVTNTLSQSAFEARYGVRVSLIAVTAAGGMVDLRLKITDAEKAKFLLQDSKNFPALWVNNITLTASKETRSQEIKLEDDGNLFILIPNAGNVVKSGASVTVLFGDMALEPISSR
jgi:hypothetical protein